MTFWHSNPDYLCRGGTQSRRTRNFQVIGKVDKVPSTPEGIRETLAQYGKVPPLGIAPVSNKASKVSSPALTDVDGMPAVAIASEPPAEIQIEALGKTPPKEPEVRRAVPTKPVASMLLDKTAEEILDAPYWVESGEIRFDPRRQRQGLISARNEGVIDDETFEAKMKTAKDVEKAAYERRRIEIQAGENPEIQALMHGAGKGAAMTMGGYLGAGTGAAAGALAGPVGSALGGVGGGVAGMVAGGAAYDAVYKQLSEWDQSYGQVLTASELKPGYNAAGQLGFVAMQLPTSAVNMAKAVSTVARVQGATEAVKFAGKAVGTGAAVGAVTDVAFQTAEQFLDEGSPGLSIESATQSAIIGAMASGVFVRGKKYSLKDLYGISERKTAGKKITPEETEALNAAARAGAEASKEGKVVGVTVEQASSMGRPEVTRPTVTVEPTRGKIGAQDQFESALVAKGPMPGTPTESFAPPVVKTVHPDEAWAAPEVMSDMPPPPPKGLVEIHAVDRGTNMLTKTYATPTPELLKSLKTQEYTYTRLIDCL